MRILFQEKSFSSLFSIVFIMLILFLSGCANNKTLETDAESVEISEIDPYEGFNRKMFVFNDVLDTYVGDPISDAYLWITPQFVQTGVSNFFSNLNGINVFINAFMQGKGKQGAEDTGRFLINSTFGMFGLFDVATDIGLEKHEEDFAQTLAVWGVPQGPYLVLPVLGPLTTRGIPGGIFDAVANPATYVGMPIQFLQILQVVNTRANVDDELNFIDEAALDTYLFTRESFLQYRKNLIADGKLDDADDLLDLDDFDEDGLDTSEDDVKANIAPETEAIENKVQRRQQDSLDEVVESIDTASDRTQ